MLNKIAAYATVRMWKMKEAMKNFREEERGDHVIEIILVLIIVVGLAVIFRDKIAALLNSLWTSITGTTKDFTPGSVGGTGTTTTGGTT